MWVGAQEKGDSISGRRVRGEFGQNGRIILIVTGTKDHMFASLVVEEEFETPFDDDD